jgi:Bacterial Ig-like domain (group 3)/Galactose oxidase, central domain/Immunoglobulin I-set domain
MQRAIKWIVSLLAFTAVLCGGFVFLHGSLPPASINAWLPAGSLTAARSGAATVLLQDGRLLITGGNGAAGPLATTDILDMSTGYAAGPSMNFARANHVAVVLQDGRVLVAGGTGADGRPASTAEIFDPAANTWSGTGPLMVPRSGATATLLQDGRVLIAGGVGTGGPTNTLEIYDPAAGTFNTAAGVLSSARENHAAALLPDGRVLILGGWDGTTTTPQGGGAGVPNVLASTDIFDPATNAVTPGPAMTVARMNFTATTALDGSVVAIGGTDGQNDLASIDVLAAGAGAFALSGASLTTARQGHQAFLLPHNGNILVVGGTSGGTAVSAVELYTPWLAATSVTGPMVSARSSATGSPLFQTVLNAPVGIDGALLMAGGLDASSPPMTLSSAEVYGFATIKTDQSDYPPGTSVTITGSGWLPNETVQMTLVEVPDLDGDSPISLTAVADANGNITNTSFSTNIDDANIHFTLTAVGGVSQAQTNFTDSTGFNAPIVEAQSPAGVAAGFSATFPVILNFTGSGTCTAGLSITSGLPSGATYGFVPASGTGTSSAASINSTLTINVAGGTAAGSYTFTVRALGSAGDCTGTSKTTNAALIVSGTAASLTVTGFPSPIAAGTPGSFLVTILDASGHVAAGYTGTVSFTSSDGAASLPGDYTFTGAGAGKDNGTHTFSATLNTVASNQTITATDTGNASITGTQLHINVTAPACTATAVTTNPTNQTVDVGQTATFTAAASGNPTPTVQWQVSTNGGGSFSNIGGATSTTLTVTPTDTTFNGNQYRAVFTNTCSGTQTATTSAATLTVNGRSTSTTVTSLSPTSVALGQGSTVTVTVVDTDASGTKSNPSGTISLGSTGAGTFGTCTLSPSGGDSATCTASYTPSGTISGTTRTDTITASFTATDNVHQNSSDTTGKPLTVTKRSTSTTVTSLSLGTVVVAQSTTVTVTVVDTDSGTASDPAGTVSLASTGAGSFGTCTLGPSGTTGTVTCTASYTPSSAAVSPQTITASFTATDNVHKDSADSTGKSLTVNRRSTSTAVSFGASTVVTGQTTSVTVTVTDTEGAGTKQFPTGTINLSSTEGTDVFTNTPCALGNTATIGVSSCTVNIKPVHVATSPHTITASFSQTDVHLASSGHSDLTVNKDATTTAVTSSANPITLGQSVSFTATVTANAPGSGTPTGSVQFYIDGSAFGSPVALSGGSATSGSTTTLTAGPHNITAVYSGDDDFFGSNNNSSPFVENVDYNFSGLLDPYAPPGVRGYKVNSAIPLKWQYADINNTVVNSSNASPVVLIYPAAGCGDTSTGDVLAIVASGNSGYQYDTTTNTWQFNWKTGGPIGAGCYVINIKSDLTGQTNGPFPIQLVR